MMMMMMMMMIRNFISLECKCNKLQFGIRICSIEVSKQKLCISTWLYMVPCLQQNFRRKSILEQLLIYQQRDSECFPESFVSVQPFSPEEHMEAAVNVWRRCFLTDESAIVDFPPPPPPPPLFPCVTI